MKGNDIESEYTVSQIVNILNISRTTLLYYEEVGLLIPHRKGCSNYRVYRNKDVLNLMNALMLRNLGFSTKEITNLQRSGDPLSEEHIGRYCARLSKHIEYLQATLSSLKRYREERTSQDLFAIRDIPRYYYTQSCSTASWSEFTKSPENDELLAHMPLSGIGSVYVDNLLAENPKTYRSRFVAEDDLRFLHIDTKKLSIIGGCSCLVVRTWSDSNMGNPLTGKQRRAARTYLDERGYRVQGSAFAPCLKPWEQYFLERYQPIVPLEAG